MLQSGAGHRAHGARAWHAGHLRLQIHTLRFCNIHCFSTVRMVARACLNVTLYAHCPSCPALYGIKILNGFHRVLVITRSVHGEFVASILLPLIVHLHSLRCV